MPETTNPFASLDNFQTELRETLVKVASEKGIGQDKDLTLPDNPVTLAPRVKSAKDWSEKQIKNAKAAGTNWKKAVLSPRKNPVEAAIAANEKRKQKLAKAEEEERWLKSMKKVNVDEMYKTIELAGAEVYTKGIAIREGKITGAIDELQPMVEALAKKLDGMPQDTPEQREAKMIAAKRGMEEIGKARRGIS